MKFVELSDTDEAALTANAAREGLTLENWLKMMAQSDGSVAPADADPQPLQAAADIVLSRMRKVPVEVMERMPKDGASQHDHYIYGWPKKEE